MISRNSVVLVLLGVGVAAAGLGSMGKVSLSTTLCTSTSSSDRSGWQVLHRDEVRITCRAALWSAGTAVYTRWLKKGHHSLLFLPGILKNCSEEMFLCIMIIVINKCKLHKLMGFSVTWLCTSAMHTDHAILTFSPFHVFLLHTCIKVLPSVRWMTKRVRSKWCMYI